MSSKLIILPKDGGGNVYMVVATTQPNFDAFAKYIREKGVVIGDLGMPGSYRADYDLTDRGKIEVRYHSRRGFSHMINGQEIVTNIGPLLLVSGLEQSVVEQEANQITQSMGDAEDLESIQQFIARLKDMS